MEKYFKAIIKGMGEDVKREGLIRTPERAKKAFEFLTKGYKQDIKKIINNAIFEEEYDEMVVVKDIEVFSLCEHHMLPFYGKCHIAYLPDRKVIGLSKLPRIVDYFSRRLQLQERLTVQIAKCIKEHLKPLGVGVVIEAFHLCIAMRGVEKQNAYATTSSLSGAFKKDWRTRMEFMNHINRKL